MALRTQLSDFERQLRVLLGRIRLAPVQNQESVIALSEVLRFRLAQCPSEDSADTALLLRLLAGIHHLFPAPNGSGVKPGVQVLRKARGKRSVRQPRCDLRPGAAIAVNMPHPDTHRALVGFRLPDWEALRSATLDAASLLPGVRTQSWDVALGPAGPVLLEVNFGGDLNLPQLAWGQGVLDDCYSAHLRECGYRL